MPNSSNSLPYRADPEAPKRRLDLAEMSQLAATLRALAPRIASQRLTVMQVTALVNQQHPALNVTGYNVRNMLVRLHIRACGLRGPTRVDPALHPAPPVAPTTAGELCAQLQIIANKVADAAASLERTDKWLARFDVMAAQLAQLEAQVRAITERPLPILTPAAPPPPPALEPHRDG